ncbi:MAG TPA: ABC transporter permease [Polyangiaceae bacterium]|jgi:NitT/TauT family transport system permease protein|nr:ABC transporter permease [Polyangiaceae bacterium]
MTEETNVSRVALRARPKRRPLLAVRKDTGPRARPWLWVSAFLLPLALWTIISYVPFVWHPLMRVTDPGDSRIPGKYSYLEADQRVERAEFDARNRELAAAHAHLARGTRANPVFLPAPDEIGRAFVTAFGSAPQRTGDFWLHESLLQSCKVIFWGFFYSALFGIPVGVLCGTFPPIARLIEPFVDFVRYMPAPVFGALAVSVLGLGDEPKITIIFIGTFFQMVLVVANTTRAVEGSLIEAAQTLGATNRQLIWHVIVPGALPQLYRDMRILIGWAWTYLVVAELIGEMSGISAFLYQQQRYRHFENVYAGIVMIGMIGLGTDLVLKAVGQYLFPWESGKRGLVKMLRSVRRGATTAEAVATAAVSMTDPV